MERMRLSRVDLALGLIVLFSISIVLFAPLVAAEGVLNLPSGIVTIEVHDGAESHFDTMLGNVPSGYDVSNSTYPGWCVDARTAMARSPVIHEVKLYSSLAAPGELADDKWDMINYILNHKQGVALDVQEAIWYFEHVDGGYTPTRPAALAIVGDALANGAGFIPGNGQVVAVICYPVILFPDQRDVQISIIEVSAPRAIPEFPSVFMLLGGMASVLIVATACRKRLKNLRIP